MDIYCGDTGNNVDFTIHCTVIAATNDKEDVIENKFDIEENSTIKSVSGSCFQINNFKKVNNLLILFLKI